MSHHPPPLHLLDLPIEILTLIIQPLLTTTHPISLLTWSSSSPASARFAHPSAILPILLTHPRLHAIATPLLYNHHEFLLDLTAQRHARTRRAFTDPLLRRGTLLGCGENTLRRIARLTLRLDRLRGWMADRVVPLLSDMVLRGQLARLDVFLTTDPSAGHHVRYEPEKQLAATVRRTGAGGPGAPPLAGIVGVLADPYLRRASMSIQTRHGAEWCQFHAARGGPCGAEEAGEEEGVVEVDWRDMIREADPAGEYFPVAKATGGRDGE
ncbi:hypothetical protein ACRE_036840 [Hapsidospora chrysogenum ATCC 11550]|uniref:Uncharacterized protein n=1 Tax=Hapsidospora chrysogenum (strain ATCC 11550 / CBS 779.69 / DSM 880 / IAM 14645 / JCM 23072 / IMI 49137) TaxID=857340 RepID=A0A086T847_HAPC1|nr:hypothetical protein ACRE_036840 [Hapsidospora chrysogenum ATCC 11550]